MADTIDLTREDITTTSQQTSSMQKVVKKRKQEEVGTVGSVAAPRPRKVMAKSLQPHVLIWVTMENGPGKI